MVEAPEFNQDFSDLVSALLNEAVDFVVVGAHAMAVHGVLRSTGDLDVLIRPEASNAARVARALVAFGAPLAAHGVTEQDFATAGTVYQLGLPPNRIDLLTQISGVEYSEAVAGSRSTVVAGVEFRVLGRAALIRNKLAAGRPKDLEDVRLLQEADADQD